MNILRSSWSIFKITFKESLAYRADMLITLISFPILFLIQYFIWNAVFGINSSNTIAGFELNQMIGYYIVSLIILIITYSHVMSELHRGVRQGDFIKYVTKPISYPYYAFMELVSHRSLAVIIELIPLTLITGLMLGFEFVLTPNLILFLVSLIFAFLINYTLSLLIGSAIFWLINPNGLAWIYRIARFVLAGGLIPLTFFPESVQKIIMLTPLPLTNFLPAYIFVGNTNILGYEITFISMIIYGLVQLLIISIITYLVWRLALKKFQGVGA